MTLESAIAEAPDNFVIRDALVRCFTITREHNKIMCSISGGADSDVMLDMIIRCDAKDKTDFVFFNTGLEYRATLEHLNELENKYGVKIIRAAPIKPIPTSCREYGVPFWSKYASNMIYRLQFHNFQWEDEPFDILIQRYPKCKAGVMWWCNVDKFGNHTNNNQYTIQRAPFMKEFIIANPPTFRISSKCCTYAKKEASHHFEKGKGYDLICIGIRRAEGGIRSAVYKNCFSEGNNSDYFRPVFWLRDCDKEEYCRHYGITHSKCYTQYGLIRTGCFGCPFGKCIDDEISKIEKYEPNLFRAANNIFGESYDYTRRYLAFREEMKRKKK